MSMVSQNASAGRNPNRGLEDTADGVEQTARSCGYGTPEATRSRFLLTGRRG